VHSCPHGGHGLVPDGRKPGGQRGGRKLPQLQGFPKRGRSGNRCNGRGSQDTPKNSVHDEEDDGGDDEGSQGDERKGRQQGTEFLHG